MSETGADQAHFSIFSENEGEAEFCMFGTDLASHTTKRASRWRNEIVLLPGFAAVFHILGWMVGIPIPPAGRRHY